MQRELVISKDKIVRKKLGFNFKLLDFDKNPFSIRCY